VNFAILYFEVRKDFKLTEVITLKTRITKNLKDQQAERSCFKISGLELDAELASKASRNEQLVSFLSRRLMLSASAIHF